MGLRTAHGSAAESLLVVESLPVDELPAPLPVNEAGLPAPLARRDDGTIADSDTARAMGAKGGRAKAAKERDLARYGLTKLSEDSDFHPYWKASRVYVECVCEEYALAVGGTIALSSQSIIGDAGTLLAAARWCSDMAMETNDRKERMALFSQSAKLIGSHRQTLLTSYEHASLLGRSKGLNPMDPNLMMARLVDLEKIVDFDGTNTE